MATNSGSGKLFCRTCWGAGRETRTGAHGCAGLRMTCDREGEFSQPSLPRACARLLASFISVPRIRADLCKKQEWKFSGADRAHRDAATRPRLATVRSWRVPESGWPHWQPHLLAPSVGRGAKREGAVGACGEPGEQGAAHRALSKPISCSRGVLVPSL